MADRVRWDKEKVTEYKKCYKNVHVPTDSTELPSESCFK